MTIILIGAIIAIIGGLIGAVGTWLHNKQSSEKSTRIESGVNKANEELSNLTGGDGNKPILIVTPTPLIFDSSNQAIPSYFMVQFVVENKGKHPLRNIKIKITDMWGREMIKYGVKHFVNGLSAGFGVVDKDSEYKNYNFNPNFDLGALSPNVSSLLYRTTYSPDIFVIPAHYNIEIIWDNGHLIHFVTFKNEGTNLILDHWEALFNGKAFNDRNCIRFGSE